MIVDCGRPKYTSPFRLDDGSKAKIRYYLASPTALFLPIAHGLREKTFWKEDKNHPGPTGEYSKRKFHPGKDYLHLPGTEYHGADPAFVDYTHDVPLVPCGYWHLGISTGSRMGCLVRQRQKSFACECDGSVSTFTSVSGAGILNEMACDCDAGLSVIESEHFTGV